jgi:hypothetical protein
MPLKRMCESLGLDVDGQRKKLTNRPWANVLMIDMLDASGRNFEMAVVVTAYHRIWGHGP